MKYNFNESAKVPTRNISNQSKIVLSILFPVLLVSWNLGFEVGAFGSILYRNLITAWIFATSVFLALLYLRFHDKLKIPTYSFFILLVPILWPIIDYIDHYIPSSHFHYFVIFDYILIVFGLLYAAYIFLRIIKHEIFKPITTSNKIAMIVFAILFSGIGFLAGHRHDLFLECSHFKLSGDYIPPNCRKGNFRSLYRHVW